MPALGHRGYYAIATETAWANNTPNVIGRQFMPVLSESFMSSPAYIFPGGIRAERVDRRKVQGGIKAAGATPWEVDVEDGIGILLKNLLPLETFTDYGPSNGALHVFTPGDVQLPPGICARVCRDLIADPTNIWDYVGGRVKKLSFTAAEGQLLKATVDLSFQKGTPAAPALSPTYTTQNPLVYHQGIVTTTPIGGNPVNVPVKAFKLDIDTGLIEGRGQLGSQYSQQSQPGMYKITGDMDLYFDNMVAVNQFLNSIDVSIVLNFLGSALGSSTRQLKFEIPTAQYTGTPPVIAGPGEIMLKMPFTGYRSGLGTIDEAIQISLLNSIRQTY